MTSFSEYVQKYPKQYAIAKSELCINLLSFLSKSGKTIKEITENEPYHNMDEKDLKILLDMLVNIKLLEKTSVGNREIFYAGEFTKLFLNEYNKTKEKYTI